MRDVVIPTEEVSSAGNLESHLFINILHWTRKRRLGEAHVTYTREKEMGFAACASVQHNHYGRFAAENPYVDLNRMWQEESHMGDP
jgi:hypothetical protein